ncbi:MAG: FecR domain-containing protein [Deltaproteobacteria bacterium]|nr:FecR domain-containing protein [Deltaproteobacteria bacterium]
MKPIIQNSKLRKFILKFLILIPILFILPAVSFAETVGFFSKIEGRVDILKEGAANAAPINVNDTVSIGDIVRTKSDGKAEITFRDDSTVRIASESRLKIDEYAFNPDNSRKRGVLDLFRGKIRAVVSKSKAIIPIGATTSSFDINTPTAIAGVRGTIPIVFHDRGVTGVIFEKGQGFVVNPNVPERVVNVTAGQITFVTKPDAPPLAPRPVTAVELAVHIKDTTPAEKPKEKKEEGDKTKEEKKTVEAKKEDKEGKKDEGKKDGKTEDKKGDGKLAEAKPANGNGGEKPTEEAPKTVEAAPQAAAAEQAAPVDINAAVAETAASVDIASASASIETLTVSDGGTAFGYTAPTETLLTAITDVVAESATLTDGSLDTLNILPITEFKETLITDGTTTTLTNLFGGVLYADNSSYPSYCLYNCGNFASLPWDSLYPDELTQSGFMQGAFGGNDLWSGSPTFYAAGTYSNPNNRPLWWTDIKGGSTDGGAFLGLTAGITQYNSLEGRLIGIYIKPDGTTGYIKSSDIFGAFDGASLWYATGTLTSYQMGATYVPSSELYFDSSYLEYSNKSHGIIGGAIAGNVVAEHVNLIDQHWGIWDGVSAGTYSSVPSTNWTAMAGGTDTDYYGYFDGYWLGNVTGTDWSNGRLAGTISGRRLGYYDMGNFSGETLGTYDAYGNWQAISLGTYTETPLAHSGRIALDINSTNLYQGLYAATNATGFMGGTTSPWSGTTSFTFMGNYTSSAIFPPYLWTPEIYSYNPTNLTNTTFDNGAYKGFIGGVWQNGTIDARVYSLYIDPSGNAGILKGSLTGAYYPSINMFEADGTWTPTALATGLNAGTATYNVVSTNYGSNITSSSFGGSSGRAYVTHYTGGNSVSVIDTTTNTVLTTIAVGTNATDLDVNPQTNRLYVAGGSTVSVIDTTTNTVIATISVTNPNGIAVNPQTNRAYVSSFSSNSVSVIDTTTNTVLTNIAVGSGPDAVAVNPQTNMAYVLNRNSNTVSVIDTTTNTVLTNIAVGTGPQDIFVNPQTNRAYVANTGSNTVSVIDTTNNTVLTAIAVGTGPTSVDVNPQTNRAYVTNYTSNTVSVIDTTTNTVIATIAVGTGSNSISVNPQTNRAYVTNSSSNTVSVIDTTTNAVVATIAVGTSPHVIDAYTLYTLYPYGTFNGAGSITVAGNSTLSATDWRYSISGQDWGIWESIIGGAYTGATSDTWSLNTFVNLSSTIYGTHTDGTQWSNGVLAGKTYGYGADITSTPMTWISVGETIGTFNPTALTWQAVQTSAWLDTNKFIDMVANNQAALTALNIPFAEVGRADLTGSGNNMPTINMNNVTFFAYSNGAAPKIWATNNVTGTFSAQPVLNTPVSLTGNGLNANFNVQQFNTTSGKWLATVDGSGTYSGTGTMNNTAVQFNGAAAGINTIGTSGSFSGTGAGVAK